ncbi:universal stress protein [Thermococcus peptonophilus]|uniref:Universal stress protein n=1 Tax=Thermococcus peptonophilus TaxID=53952 RepID=A0A142CSN9_9EURY|nr:hypothetical protein [Thermococcus peptonophilus]AMQ17791.1 hypothetical protein A0127_00685 [Thermococcus peptonophilus]
MGWLHDIILRKFNNIAGTRYEEILKAYENFFLTEEELVIPEINSVLLAFDRFSCKVSEEVYETISAFNEATVQVVYVIDEGVLKMIQETLGEEAAEEFREKEIAFAETFLRDVEKKLDELNFKFNRKIAFGDKAEYVKDLSKEYDLLVISRRYGSEATKTHRVSPVVFRIVQHVEKPVVLY